MPEHTFQCCLQQTAMGCCKTGLDAGLYPHKLALQAALADAGNWMAVSDALELSSRVHVLSLEHTSRLIWCPSHLLQAPPADGGGLDMFSEDADTDMFAATPVAGRAGAAQANKPRALADNFDDAEGYYNFQASIVCMLCAHGMGCTELGCSCSGPMLQTVCVLQMWLLAYG